MQYREIAHTTTWAPCVCKSAWDGVGRVNHCKIVCVQKGGSACENTNEDADRRVGLYGLESAHKVHVKAPGYSVFEDTFLVHVAREAHA